MSSCLVLQAKDKLYIGADTSSSVFIDDKLYRLNNNTKKLFLLNANTVLYCAGNNSIAEKVVQYIYSIYQRNDFSIMSLKNWLVEMYPYKNKDKTVYDVEILIATFKNNRTVVYQMSQYKNYDIISFEVSDAGVQILSAGIKNAECMSFAENELLNKSDVKSIFRTTFNNLSCNYIGGYLDLYEISKNGAVKIFDNEKINEHGIQYVHDVFNGLSVSLNAEVLVSKLVMSENLWLENQSGTYKFDDAGFIASSGKNSVRIQPNQSGELFSIYKGNNKQFYVDSDGNVHFTGDLTGSSGTFSGNISGGSINLGNGTFTVDSNGNMYASSGSFGGNLNAAGGTFTGTLSGVDGTFTGTLYGNEIVGANISGSVFKTTGSDSGFTGTVTIKDGTIEARFSNNAIMYSLSPRSFIVGNNLIEAYSARFNQIKFANGAFVVNEGDIIANEDFYINKNLYINGINFDSYIDDINDAYTMAVNAAPKEHSHSKYTTENEVKTIIKQMVKSSALK